VTGFHVRGSSEKEKINLNKLLSIIVLHEDDLYMWQGNSLSLIEQKVSNLYYQSDDTVLFKTTDEV